MALKNKGGQGQKQEFVQQEPLAAGTYEARLVQIIELGLQPQRPYKGEDKKPAPEIMFTYELVEEFMKDEQGNEIEDKPRWISETLPFYGTNAERSKAAKRYQAFDPDDVHDSDYAACAGSPVNVTIVVNKGKEDKVYENVAAVTAMTPKKAAKCPELVNPIKLFDLDNPDLEVFNKLPQWIQDKIKKNLNFNGSPLQKLLGAPDNEQEEEEEEDKGYEKAAPDEDDDDRPF